MEYRVLGKTGLKISRIGLGGIPIQRIDAEGTRTLLHQLMDAGVNYIDTARGYTVSEEYLGYGLEGIRDKFILATKSMARTREAMAKDIETYGLFTFAEMNEIAPLPEKMFEEAGGAYLKVSIGKGNLTMEELVAMIQRYTKFFA